MKRKATSRATPSAAPTACGSTRVACCVDPDRRVHLHLGKGDYINMPNNQMLACDPTAPGGPQIRRFLVGPNGCEITGITATADLKTFYRRPAPGEPGR